MDQNPVGFPNLMYLHVGTYTPYFGSGYGGIRSVLIVWPPMSNPLVNPTTPPQLVLGIAQTKVVTNHREPLDEDKESSERKHNPKMPQIIPINKFHERRGKSSPIGNISDMTTRGRVVHFSKGGDRPFDDGGNKPPRGGGSPLRDGGGSR
jgi:hypothetical protein